MSDYCLFLETSFKGAALALADLSTKDPTFLYLKQTTLLENTPATLSEMAKEALQSAPLQKKEPLSWQEVKKICLSVGPGSFTGIRTGIAWSLGIKAALDQIALKSLSALEALLELHCEYPSDRPAAVFLPSTKTHGFVSYIDQKNQKVSTRLISVTDKEALELLFTQINQKDLIFILEGWPALEALLAAKYIAFAIKNFATAQQEALLGMLTKAYREDFQLEHIPAPAYLRASSAEEQRDQRRGQHETKTAPAFKTT